MRWFYIYIYMFCVIVSLEIFASSYQASNIPNTNNLQTTEWFQTFLISIITVLSYYINLIKLIC